MLLLVLVLETVHSDIGTVAKPHFVAKNFSERVVELIGSKSFGCRKDHRKLYAPPPLLPQHNFLLFPFLFLCYIFLFVALLKLSTRNAPSRFCKSNQNRNQMQIGIRLVCLRSLKRCITLSPSPSLAHSLSGGFNFKLDRHTLAGRKCGWDGLRNCCENCDRFFTSPD